MLYVAQDMLEFCSFLFWSPAATQLIPEGVDREFPLLHKLLYV
jgi:hypothetical protein